MIKFGFPFLLITLFSCGIYRQNVVNTPLMEQKGQTQLSGHINFNGLEGQAAFAVTNKIAFLANYNNMGIRKKEYSATNNKTWKHHFKEIGVGVFEKTTTGKIREVFVLAGNGMTSHIKGSNSQENQEVDYNRFAVQADWGNKSKKVEKVVSPRLLAVHYYRIADNSRNDYQNISNFHIYAEAAVTIRYPIFKFLMISNQLGATLPLTHSGDYNYYYEFSPFYGSIGLVFNINQLSRLK